MKQIFFLIILSYLCFGLNAQSMPPRKTRLIAGISGPELVHAGITHRIADISQLGINAGAGPSMNSIWTAFSIEHRLYFGKRSEKSDQKMWFCRQGSTFFPSAKPSQKLTFNLTAGKDIPFKNGKNGFTIDAGVFYQPESERSSILLIKSLNLLPALRAEFYFSL